MTEFGLVFGSCFGLLLLFFACCFLYPLLSCLGRFSVLPFLLFLFFTLFRCGFLLLLSLLSLPLCLCFFLLSLFFFDRVLSFLFEFSECNRLFLILLETPEHDFHVSFVPILRVLLVLGKFLLNLGDLLIAHLRNLQQLLRDFGIEYDRHWCC